MRSMKTSRRCGDYLVKTLLGEKMYPFVLSAAASVLVSHELWGLWFNPPDRSIC